MHIKAETAVGLFVITALGALFYMSFNIGFLRVDKARYALYSAQFKDSAGLSKKAEVKIAGMKVGWVDTITLSPEGTLVTVQFLVLKKYRLFQNACATIRQEGILGGKYIDLSPGLSHLPRLPVGSMLIQQYHEQASVDELFINLKKVAQTVCDMGAVVQAQQGTFKSTLEACKQLAEKLTILSQRLEVLTASNQDTVIALLQDTQLLMRDLKERVPSITHTVGTLADTLTNTVVPEVRQQYTKLTSVASQSCAQVDQVLQKINDDNSFLGKLLCDKTTSEQLQRAVYSLDYSLAKINKLAYALDGHVESINTHNTHNNMCCDFKSYARFKVQPTENYFLLGGLVTCKPRRRNSCNLLTLDLQLGIVGDNWALRGGIFENTLGCAFDWRVPFIRKYCTWVTSFELYSILGCKSAYCNWSYSPQIKWFNKVYVNPNIYFVFGAYNLMSKYTKNFFIGAGIRFGTDYTKYPNAYYLW